MERDRIGQVVDDDDSVARPLFIRPSIGSDRIGEVRNLGEIAICEPARKRRGPRSLAAEISSSVVTRTDEV